jgi:hypothetical protein
VRVVVSENTVIPEEITVHIDFADICESDKNVTVGSMFRRGRGCWEAIRGRGGRDIGWGVWVADIIRQEIDVDDRPRMIFREIRRWFCRGRR